MAKSTIIWNIAQLERESADGYVYTAHWSVNATETVEDKTYSVGAYGSIGFQRPEEDLIPFENLTEELIVSWIQEKLDVETYETSLQSQIDEQKTPSKLSGVPW
jgi:hypothetical protein